jgi:very-short-patch-repair endonuclease
MPHRFITDRYRSHARALRRDMTDAETKIWQRLRAHRFMGLSFRRQFPVGPYIVDFVCLEARLIIEIDGGQHASDRMTYDGKRDEWLKGENFRILRFWNNDVLKNPRGVLERVADAVQEPLPPSLTLVRKGGGDAPSTTIDLSNARDPKTSRSNPI